MTETQQHITLSTLERRLSAKVIREAVADQWDDIADDLKVVRNRKGNKLDNLHDYYYWILYDIIIPASNMDQYADSIMERVDDEMAIFVSRIRAAIQRMEFKKQGVLL